MIEDGHEIEIEDEPVLAKGPDINVDVGVDVAPVPMPPSTYLMLVKSGTRLHEETCGMVVKKKDYFKGLTVSSRVLCAFCRESSSVKRPNLVLSFRSSFNFTVLVSALGSPPIGCLSCVGNATEVKP